MSSALYLETYLDGKKWTEIILKILSNFHFFRFRTFAQRTEKELYIDAGSGYESTNGYETNRQ